MPNRLIDWLNRFSILPQVLVWFCFGAATAVGVQQSLAQDPPIQDPARKTEQTARPPAAKENPAFAEVVDEPGLPRVLLLGDSISIGYTLAVREALRGKANVHRPPTNCASTRTGVKGLERWLGDGSWDVIHFNFGLHDLKYVVDGSATLVDIGTAGSGHQVPLGEYESNLAKIVEKLKSTGAKLIWCNTTPVPEGARGREPKDVAMYNARAIRVMEAHKIALDDLHGFALPQLAEIQRPQNVHFTAKGSRDLAGHVASAILRELQLPDR